jgi:(4S)-4-hydroxy-5-phosphonooxypentane-2,3-dione isomerase
LRAGRRPWLPVVTGHWVVADRQNRGMLIVHVTVHVVPDQLEAFLAATEANATASLEEPGVLRFDVVADLADPAHVVLVEVYRDEAGAAAHKETAHYATWRDSVAPMMAVPRASTKFSAVFPAQASRWATPPS